MFPAQVFGYIYKNRLKIKNFFIDFDRHMRGIIPADQFKSALHGMAGAAQALLMSACIRVLRAETPEMLRQ